MRTARAFTVCRSLLLGGGVVPAWSGGVPAWSGGVYLPGLGGVYLPGPGGCTCLVWGEGVYLPGPRGCTCLVLGGVYLPGHGGCTYLVWGGVPAWSWGGVPAWSRGCTCLVAGGCTWSGTPPLVDRMTHAYENITLPQTSFAGGKKTILDYDHCLPLKMGTSQPLKVSEQNHLTVTLFQQNVKIVALKKKKTFSS